MLRLLDALYRVFRRYPLPDDTGLCPHCRGDERLLRAAPLRELTQVQLSRYAFKALTTWGDVRVFKHFLPRLFELVVTGALRWPTADIVFGKLALAEWQRWPGREVEAVDAVLREWWRAGHEEPDIALRAMELAYGDVSPFLNELLHDRSEAALLRVAALVDVAPALRTREVARRLEDGFFAATSEQAQEKLSAALRWVELWPVS